MLPRALALLPLSLLSLVAACAAGSSADGDATAQADLGSAGAPVKLADTEGARTRLRLSATHVYFVDAARHAVVRVAKTGGALEDVLVAPGPVDDVFLDDTHVWALVDEPRPSAEGFGEIVRAPLAGGAIESRLGGDLAGGTITADASYVYVAAAGRIARFPKDGTFMSADVLAEALPNSAGLAVGDHDVFWGDMGPGNPAIGCNRGDGKVMAMPKTGGAARVVADLQDCPVALTLDGGTVWFRSFFGPLRKVAEAGGVVTEAATNAISDPAIDGAQAFFGIATRTETELESVSSGSLLPTMLASTLALAPRQITAVAVDASRIYYALADLATNRAEILSVGR
jgi:hypothetical protein